MKLEQCAARVKQLERRLDAAMSQVVKIYTDAGCSQREATKQALAKLASVKTQQQEEELPPEKQKGTFFKIIKMEHQLIQAREEWVQKKQDDGRGISGTIIAFTPPSSPKLGASRHRRVPSDISDTGSENDGIVQRMRQSFDGGARRPSMPDSSWGQQME
jgi:hypothetical protein